MTPTDEVPNYAVALAGAFTALEALNKARSIGKFYHPNPVHEAMAGLEKDVQKLIHLTIVEATKVGQNL